MSTQLKLKPIVAALGIGLALAAGPVSAAVTWYSPITNFEDNDLDFHLTSQLVADADGILDQGDVLVAVFQFDSTVNSDQTQSAAITGGELTGISGIQVTNKSAKTGFLDVNGDGIQQITEPDTFTFTFGAYSGGLDAILALGGVSPLAGALGNAGNGAMVSMYFDTTADLGAPPNCSSLANCIALAGDGDLFQVDGFAGDVDEFWRAINAVADISAVKTLPAVSKVATLNFGLSIMFNGTGQNLLTVSCAPFCSGGGGDDRVGMLGSGDILGGAGLTNGAAARSDIDFQKSIPEPATLALLGLGLLGMGASMRKRKA